MFGGKSHGFYEESVRARAAQEEDGPHRRRRGLRRAAADCGDAVHRFRAVLIAKTEKTPLPIVWKRHFLDLCLTVSAAQNAGGALLQLLDQG